ncbi:MAG TPA: Asp23/Gls24 family envelope stress response protein, partial [Clostridiaceae bacterium]|nr:Asp23/Gls24 family envelope stress response protein [Clostridiaceae bacterium]
PTKGVKVEINGKDVTIDFYILVDYGARIPEVAWRIQEKVKSAVESMTGMNVTAINIHVQGISFDKLKEEKRLEESAR